MLEFLLNPWVGGFCLGMLFYKIVKATKIDVTVRSLIYGPKASIKRAYSGSVDDVATYLYTLMYLDVITEDEVKKALSLLESHEKKIDNMK